MRLAFASVLLAAACASSSGGSSSGTSRNTDVITAQEIEVTQVPTAYDVVQQLRPHFLRPRAGSGPIVVYIDGVRRGDTSELRSIDKSIVREIRYLDANDATTLYGTGHGSGAILVSTRR
jgi:hypothetical protein